MLLYIYMVWYLYYSVFIIYIIIEYLKEEYNFYIKWEKYEIE